MKIHIVQRDDTFESIANRYGVSVQDLVGMNTHINHLAGLVPGLKVKVPSVNRKEEGNVAKHIQKYYPNLDTSGVELKAKATTEAVVTDVVKQPEKVEQVVVKEEEVIPVPLKPIVPEIKAKKPNDGVKVENVKAKVEKKVTAVKVESKSQIQTPPAAYPPPQHPLPHYQGSVPGPLGHGMAYTQPHHTHPPLQGCQGPMEYPPHMHYPPMEHPPMEHFPMTPYACHPQMEQFAMPSCEMVRGDERFFVSPGIGWGYPSWGWGYPVWGRPGWGRPGWGGHHRGDSSPMVNPEDERIIIAPGIGWGYPYWGGIGWGRPGWGYPGWGRPGWGRPGWGRPGWGGHHRGDLSPMVSPEDERIIIAPGIGWGYPYWGGIGWGRPGWGYLGWGRPGWGRPGWGRPGWGGHHRSSINF